MIADYFIVRKQKLVVAELFVRGGRYDGSNGWNLKGLAALAIVAIALVLVGFMAFRHRDVPQA